MVRNLDVEWAGEHPATPREQRTFMWGGATLTRREEVPLSAFRLVEEGEGGADVQPLLSAIRLSLESASHEAWDGIVARGEIGLPRLIQLWRFVVAEGSGRPTQPPADSSDGPSANGTDSTGGASTDEDWTSGGSVPVASPTSPTPSS